MEDDRWELLKELKEIQNYLQGTTQKELKLLYKNCYKNLNWHTRIMFKKYYLRMKSSKTPLSNSLRRK